MKGKLYVIVVILVGTLAFFYFKSSTQEESFTANKAELTTANSVSDEVKTDNLIKTQDRGEGYFNEVDLNHGAAKTQKLESLQTNCFANGDEDICIELIDISYLDNGEIWKKTYKLNNDSIQEIVVNFPDGYENGYNFNPVTHEYWDQELDIIEQLALQGDIKAQYVYAAKAYYDVKADISDVKFKKAEEFAIRAANKGYNAALTHVAQFYYERNQQLKSFAYRLASLQNAPKELQDEPFTHFERIPDSAKEEVYAMLAIINERINSAE